ncbi:YfhO family protein [Streptomyces tricolor]|nr:YfhO family protein [Streptomyces tricolor]
MRLEPGRCLPQPEWLDGLIALPLLCLVGERALTGRRYLPGVLIVALAWTANFYTAYMATLGAALVLLLRLLLARPARRRARAAAGRAALTTALGVGLSPPRWSRSSTSAPPTPTRAASAGSSPYRPRTSRPGCCPATYGFSSPALYVGLTALLWPSRCPSTGRSRSPVRTGWTGPGARGGPVPPVGPHPPGLARLRPPRRAAPTGRRSCCAACW